MWMLQPFHYYEYLVIDNIVYRYYYKDRKNIDTRY